MKVLIIATGEALVYAHKLWIGREPQRGSIWVAPQARTSGAENVFKIQLMNADRIGTYVVSGSFEDFESYAVYRTNNGGSTKTYHNKINGKSFHVVITEFLPQENFGDNVPGIKGSFSGTLYNKDNALDSLKINHGEFVFQKTNWYNFDHCKE